MREETRRDRFLGDRQTIWEKAAPRLPLPVCRQRSLTGEAKKKRRRIGGLNWLRQTLDGRRLFLTTPDLVFGSHTRRRRAPRFREESRSREGD